MDLDAKHSVLYAIYTEYQKDIPDMSLVTPEVLGIEKIVFNIAVNKLENEGYIRGTLIPKILGEIHPVNVILYHTKMTREGMDYVEKALELSAPQTNKERVQSLTDKFKEYGWDALTTFAAKVVVEIGIKTIS